MRLQHSLFIIVLLTTLTLAPAASADVCELIPEDKADVAKRAKALSEAAIGRDPNLAVLGIVPQHYDSHAAALAALVETAAAQKAYGVASRSVGFIDPVQLSDGSYTGIQIDGSGRDLAYTYVLSSYDPSTGERVYDSLGVAAGCFTADDKSRPSDASFRINDSQLATAAAQYDAPSYGIETEEPCRETAEPGYDLVQGTVDIAAQVAYDTAVDRAQRRTIGLAEGELCDADDIYPGSIEQELRKAVEAEPSLADAIQREPAFRSVSDKVFYYELSGQTDVATILKHVAFFGPAPGAFGPMSGMDFKDGGAFVFWANNFDPDTGDLTRESTNGSYKVLTDGTVQITLDRDGATQTFSGTLDIGGATLSFPGSGLPSFTDDDSECSA